MSAPYRPWIVFATLLLATSLHAATLTGTVVAVADGDTITVLDSEMKQHKIRLLGIDAPEKMQPFGRKSKFSLSDMVYLKQVVVDYEKQDRYGRTLGKVLVEGKDANLMQVERGMAWWYRDYAQNQSTEDRLLYESSERIARNERLGLWSDKQPIPPWKYRRSRQ